MRSHTAFVVTGGMCVLLIVMGVGRFAYTPILPLMHKAGQLSIGKAGILASMNYLGYLAGAVLAGAVHWKQRKVISLQLSLILNIVLTIAMGFTSGYSLWLIFRFASGLTSALGFVLSSSLVLDMIAAKAGRVWNGIFYSGVGTGIVLTGVLVPVMDRFAGWRSAWIGLGFLSILIAVIPWTAFRSDSAPSGRTAVNPNDSNPPKQIGLQPRKKQDRTLLPWLIIAYGCEGFGYIISGTFLVVIVEQIPYLSHAASFVWALVGAAAIPSSIFWAVLAGKWGYPRMILAAFLVQIVGVGLPALLFNAFGAVTGAVLFGGTFMGITMMANSLARDITPGKSSKVIGYLTASYSLGQVLGPLGASFFMTATGNDTSALIFASAVLLFGAMIFMIGQRTSSSFQP